MNDDLMGEWQYLLKIGKSYLKSPNEAAEPCISFPSLNTTVVENPIFDIGTKYRKIAWGGGPGMYPVSENVKPLLIYNEEPMYTKPIHFWMPNGLGWIRISRVETDIKNSLAGICTTYGRGRIVAFGDYPEYLLVIKNGTVVERVGHGYVTSKLHINRMTYAYVGELYNFCYNIWMVRRSLAWLANLNHNQYPPYDETGVWIIDPDPQGALYLSDKIIRLNKKVGTPSIVENDFNITVMTSRNIERVEFYIDGNIQNLPLEKMESSFAIFWKVHVKNLDSGLHNLLVRAFDERGNYAEDSASFIVVGSGRFELPTSAS